MAIAGRLQTFLEGRGVAYELIPHEPTGSSEETARASHVALEQLVKSVLLVDDRGYALAVVPASHRVDLDELRRVLDRSFELASEAELNKVFLDCETGSVPPTGFVYGIPTFVDEALMHSSSLHFESGDRRLLVHLTGAEFTRIMSGAPNATISREVDLTPSPPLRGRQARSQRLDAQHAQVFSLRAFGAGLREQSQYEREGHSGVTLVKTDQQRVILEAAQAGVTLSTHVVHGSTMLYVLSGALDVTTAERTFRVGEAEMASLPADQELSLIHI